MCGAGLDFREPGPVRNPLRQVSRCGIVPTLHRFHRSGHDQNRRDHRSARSGSWASAQVATLKADYRFQNSVASSIVGAPSLTNAGASTCDSNGSNSFAKLTVGTRKMPVLHFHRDGGVVGPAYPVLL
jgi:hypothetical protein